MENLKKSVPQRIHDLPYLIEVVRSPNQQVKIEEIYQIIKRVAAERDERYRQFIGREREYVKPPSLGLALKVAKLMQHWSLLTPIAQDVYEKTPECKQLAQMMTDTNDKLTAVARKFLYHLMLRVDYARPITPSRFIIPIRDNVLNDGLDGVALDDDIFVHQRLHTTHVDVKVVLYWMTFLGMTNYQRVSPEERNGEYPEHRMFNVMHAVRASELFPLREQGRERTSDIEISCGATKDTHTRARALATVAKKLSPILPQQADPIWEVLDAIDQTGIWAVGDHPEYAGVASYMKTPAKSLRRQDMSEDLLNHLYFLLPITVTLEEFQSGLQRAYQAQLIKSNLRGVSVFLWLPEVMEATCMDLRITDAQFLKGLELLYRKRLVEVRPADRSHVSEYFYMRPHRRDIPVIEGVPQHLIRIS
ncbi:hypothetical protein HYR99_13510 [Candidatus Poribacteria bacterium]|nr:hypothetical protein [Candidatus Poribacteria bacterium]